VSLDELDVLCVGLRYDRNCLTLTHLIKAECDVHMYVVYTCVCQNWRELAVCQCWSR